MDATADRDSEGFFSGLVNKYDEIWKTVIMPTRTKYSLEHLGPGLRRMSEDGVYVRNDCQKTNLRGEKLEVTVYTRATQPTAERHCLVYLHSHGGSRIEGLGLLPFAWELGMDFCIFDFSGSGMSEGAYTTLGMRESEDCSAVIELLQRDFGASKFILWGRSMGAVAAIMYSAGRLPHVKALVLDTPFSTVDAMVRDAGNSYAPLGEYLASFLFGLIKEDIKSKIGQDLASFSPILTCSKCTAPCVFMAATNDKLVPCERIDEQFQAWGGHPKEIIKIPGSHSSSREAEHIRTVVDRLKAILDKVASNAGHRGDLSPNPKQILSLGGSRPKAVNQKENIRPTGSPSSQEERSPRPHNFDPRLLHGYHGPGATQTAAISTQNKYPSRQGSPKSHITAPSNQDQDGSQRHIQAQKDASQRGQHQNLISINPQGTKSIAPAQKLPGPKKVLQINSPLVPLTSLSPNNPNKISEFEQDVTSAQNVWGKLPPNDESNLGYYQKKYLQEQKQQMLRQREQQYMGQPRYSGLNEALPQPRLMSPAPQLRVAEPIAQIGASGISRPQGEVFSKFTPGGPIDNYFQSRQGNGTSGIRERTPLPFQHQRSISKTPATAEATPAGGGYGSKWEASYARDHRLIPVQSPQLGSQQHIETNWNEHANKSGSGRQTPKTRTISEIPQLQQPGAIFQRLDSIMPSQAGPGPKSFWTFERAATQTDVQEGNVEKRRGFKIFEENRYQSASNEVGGGNFQPLDLGWDNSLIMKVNDTSSFVKQYSGTTREPGWGHSHSNSSSTHLWDQATSKQSGESKLEHLSKAQPKLLGNNQSAARQGGGQPLNLLSKQPSFVSHRQPDRLSELPVGLESFRAGKTTSFASHSHTYVPQTSGNQQPAHSDAFRAPGPNSHYSYVNQ